MIFLLVQMLLFTQPKAPQQPATPATPIDLLEARREQDALRMPSWPGPRQLSNDWRSAPRWFLESMMYFTVGIHLSRLSEGLSAGDIDGSGIVSDEPTVRGGVHLGRGHIVGLTYCRILSNSESVHEVDGSRRYISEIRNPIFAFYRYAIPSTPTSIQIEPILVHWGLLPDHTMEDQYGARLSFQVAKNTNLMRVAVEVRVDLTVDLFRPTFSLVWGTNF